MVSVRIDEICQKRPRVSYRPATLVTIKVQNTVLFKPRVLPLVSPTMLGNIQGYVKQLKSTHDDDSTDRLNYVTTITLLIGLAATLFMKNYVGEPLQCWAPAQWTGDWESFAENYCFVENTYFVPMNSTTLPDVHTREGREMIYYQWVPFILLLMGLLFYVPRAIWKIFSTYSGLTLPDMMLSARETAKSKNDVDGVGNRIAFALKREHVATSDQSVRYGSYLSSLYLTVKILILVNVCAQLFFLNHWLGTQYTFWGLGVLIDMVQGKHWQESGHFPRVTYCDVIVREMGNVNNWTLQCVLVVNMFNEKIFIFLWFWFAAVAILTASNLLIWLWRRTAAARLSFLRNLLDVHMTIGDRDIETFYYDVLKPDGLLLLRMIDDNAGSIMAADVAWKLWKANHPDTHRDSDSITHIDEDEKKPLLS